MFLKVHILDRVISWPLVLTVVLLLNFEFLCGEQVNLACVCVSMGLLDGCIVNF